MVKRILLFTVVLAIITLAGLDALDYGGLLITDLEAEGRGDNYIKGDIIFAPWLSAVFPKSELYFAAGINATVSKESYLAPEIFRLEYSHRLNQIFSFRVGRFSWIDPSRITAQGRFDGAEVIFSIGQARLGVNCLYTGLLLKDTAEINVSPTDSKNYSRKFTWSDFADTYFAPRRILTALYGEFPGFPKGRSQIYAGLMAQFDVSGADEAFHTQYLLGRYVFTYKALDLDAALAFELENTKSEGVKPALALSFEAGWLLPGKLRDRLALGFVWASGKGATGAFFPVSTTPAGFVLKPKLSAVMDIRLDYHVHLIKSLSVDFEAHYFWRTDAVSFSAPFITNSNYSLGMEINAGALWVPVSDLAVTLNAGLFIPQTGNAWSGDAKVFWRMILGATFSF